MVSSYQRLKNKIERLEKENLALRQNLNTVIERPESFEGMNIIAHVKFNNQCDRVLLFGEKWVNKEDYDNRVKF